MRLNIDGKTYRLNRGKIKRLIVLLLVLFILISILIVVMINNHMNEVRFIAILNSVLELLNEKEEEVNNSDVIIEEEDKSSGRGRYGIYPVDNELRIKQEMIEICDRAGSAYGIPGYFILALAMVETEVNYKLPTLEDNNGSLYTDLCIGYYTYRSSGQDISIFQPTGKVYEDANGNSIREPIKVGEINTDIGLAIGPFQFYNKHMHETFTRMYVKDGDEVIGENVKGVMQVFDEGLGFLRPHPLYFPDAAINAAHMIKQRMDSHKSYVSDINTTDKIIKELLFIYASDAYHGDTYSRSNGEAGRILHSVMGSMYFDIFNLYKDRLNSLGDFSKDEFNKGKVRTLLGGVPFNVRDSSGRYHIDFDGTFIRSSDLLKEDSNGRYLELGGYKYYQPLIAEASNSNYNYRQIVANMPAVGGGGTNNKFSWVHGFEGLNTVAHFKHKWEKAIELAEKIKEIPEVTHKLPYEIGQDSKEEMLVAATSLVGKVRYVYSGGHGFNTFTGINPLWRKFNQIYSVSDNDDLCIRPNKDRSWCPIHGSYQGDCLYSQSKVFRDLNSFKKDTNMYYASYGKGGMEIYDDTDMEMLNRIISTANQGIKYHTLEGLDCSSYVGWVFNQSLTNRRYSGASGNFIVTNSLSKVSGDSRVLPGDIYTWDDHIVLIVGEVNSSNNTFLVLECAPPVVKFGVLYKDKADSEISEARAMATAANMYFGDYNGNVNIYNSKKIGGEFGRASVSFRDLHINNLSAVEILEILRDRIPMEYIGR